MTSRSFGLMIAIAACAGIAAPGEGQSPVPSSQGTVYAIELRIEDGDRLVGTPTLTLRENSPVVMTVNTHDGYSLRATFGTEMVQGALRGNLSTDVFFARDGAWQHRGSPWISAPLGQRATIEIASRDGADPLRIAYRATARANP